MEFIERIKAVFFNLFNKERKIFILNPEKYKKLKFDYSEKVSNSEEFKIWKSSEKYELENVFGNYHFIAEIDRNFYVLQNDQYHYLTINKLDDHKDSLTIKYSNLKEKIDFIKIEFIKQEKIINWEDKSTLKGYPKKIIFYNKKIGEIGNIQFIKNDDPTNFGIAIFSKDFKVISIEMKDSSNNNISFNSLDDFFKAILPLSAVSSFRNLYREIYKKED
ncbi:hypothetical protein EII28_09520 [Fusobacterium nucleatum]|uniref:Uncharacterized protein n=1 Tax=Fusobacterium nucleatum TaxID=851 RepID=A0A3P1VPQ5_FUSNU|nr:hypothetical protein [Fusobacterium nucleatum]RRD35536.1 hypothetical protein EII28_09520 [Fusobacterium nucleatum]